MGVPPGDKELVQIMDAALANAARRAGERLVCRPGCTQCCHGAFAINGLDVLRLREGLDVLERTEPAVAAEIKRRAEDWIAEYGASFPGDPETGVLGTREEERARFEEYADDAPCPALNPETGLCDVYPWRPMTCRVFGPPVRMEAPDGSSGLGHCELCFEGASAEEVAACEMPVPHDLELRLVEEIGGESGGQGETIVALAVLG